MKKANRKIILGISGASGAPYAKLLIDRILGLKKQPSELAIIFSENAVEIWKHEVGERPEITGPVKIYNNDDFYAPFASGSSNYDTMIICPCSMGMLGRIAHGVSDDLITRAADVMLKERRKLILVPRETPYSLVHITNMKLLTQAGSIIIPATPSFYSKPKDISSLLLSVVDRVLDLAGIKVDTFRWGDELKKS